MRRCHAKAVRSLFAQLPRTELFFSSRKETQGLSGLLHFRRTSALHRPDVLIDLHSVLRSQLRMLFRWSGIPSWHFAKQRKLKQNAPENATRFDRRHRLSKATSRSFSPQDCQPHLCKARGSFPQSGQKDRGVAPSDLLRWPLRHKNPGRNLAAELVRKWVDEGRRSGSVGRTRRKHCTGSLRAWMNW